MLIRETILLKHLYRLSSKVLKLSVLVNCAVIFNIISVFLVIVF